MPLSAFGGQSYSISNSGTMLFQQGVIKSFIGGVEVDLVSAPIEPGEYKLEVQTGDGGIEIFLPRYVQFTIDGGSILGGRDMHTGTEQWARMQKKLRKIVTLPDEPPAFALASHDERPVNIHFTFRTGLGGVDIYKL